MHQKVMGMSDVCLIPCYSRPEFLWHCLRNIEKADGVEDIQFLFRPDRGYNPEILDVITSFKLDHRTLQTPEDTKAKRIPQLMKQSWSVLTGMGMAATIAENGLVFYIEEDVMVAPDFFTWCREAVKGRFCSIASEDTNTAANKRPKDNGEPSYDSHGTYRGIGVCFSADTLRTFVQPHCQANYFLHPWTYLKNNFPQDPLRSSYCEQDGLIRRIQRSQTSPIAYPFEPKCYHAGYYGYNRRNPNQAKGSVAQRIEEVAKVIYSHEEMKRVNHRTPAFYEDSKPIPCLTSDPTPQQ